MKSKCLWIVLAMVLGVTGVAAQDTLSVVRPAHRVIDVSAGAMTVRDTYLTPVAYDGVAVGIHLDHFQATGFAPERWVRRLELGIEYGGVHNPARRSNTMHSVTLSGQWSLARRWRVKSLQPAVGAMTDLSLGALYNPAGSNNPVSVKARWGVGAVAMLGWHTRLAHRPLTLTGTLSIPVLGVWFAPDGYESYYEIYLGNREHLAHLAWWGNRFDLSASVAADWQLGGTTLRLVYRHTYETTSVRGLDTRMWRNTVGIGIGGDFVTLSPRRSQASGTIINAHY